MAALRNYVDCGPHIMIGASVVVLLEHSSPLSVRID
jgi:hypothetical protein